MVGLFTGGGSVPQDDGRRFLRSCRRRFEQRVHGEIAVAVHRFFSDGALQWRGHDGDVQIFRKGDVLQLRFGDVEVLPCIKRQIGELAFADFWSLLSGGDFDAQLEGIQRLLETKRLLVIGRVVVAFIYDIDFGNVFDADFACAAGG